MQPFKLLMLVQVSQNNGVTSRIGARIVCLQEHADKALSEFQAGKIALCDAKKFAARMEEQHKATSAAIKMTHNALTVLQRHMSMVEAAQLEIEGELAALSEDMPRSLDGKEQGEASGEQHPSFASLSVDLSCTSTAHHSCTTWSQALYCLCWCRACASLWSAEWLSAAIMQLCEDGRALLQPQLYGVHT